MKRDSAHVLLALGEANPPLHADHKHSFKEHAEYVGALIFVKKKKGAVDTVPCLVLARRRSNRFDL